jgi:hypothetical protein
VSDGRYIADEAKFKQYAYTALTGSFPDHAAFENFYVSLDDSLIKDEFLRVTSFYLFLVKRGEWHVTVEGSAPVIDYLSTSFKVVALFALIESLSDEQHQDFYDWLCSQNPESTFPIPDRAALSKLNEGYKASYGSIRPCVAFFSRLPPDRQQALCSAIRVGGNPLVSIKKVAEFLYDLRNKFVHEARPVWSLVGFMALEKKKKKVVKTDLSVGVLLDTFEEGVLAYFRHGT